MRDGKLGDDEDGRDSGHATRGRDDSKARSRALVLEPFLVPLGARVREMRLARGMSLAMLEVASGVLKGSLSGIEHGRINVTIWTCLKIANGLGVEMVELFGDGSGED